MTTIMQGDVVRRFVNQQREGDAVRRALQHAAQCEALRLATGRWCP